MGSSVSCDGAGSASHLLTFECEEKYEHSFHGNADKNVKEIFPSDFESSSEEDSTDLMIGKLDVLVSEYLHDHGPPESHLRNSLNQNSICKQLEVDFASFDTYVLEGLKKHDTILCSEFVQAFVENSDAEDGLSCVRVPNKNLLEVEDPALVPQLPTARPISALKGSRAQCGIQPNTKLSVKWAPEVYDPPVTSSSHTVKGHRRNHHHRRHHHSSKSKKDHHSHTHAKGRSSSGNSCERKHSHRRSSGSSPTDPRITRLQTPGCNEPILQSCSQPKMEPHGLALETCEVVDCGKSCYMEPYAAAQLQLPVAKVA